MAIKQVRTGVVGLGAFGRHHVRHMANNPDADLVGVCDEDQDRAEQAAAQYGCRSFDRPEDLIGAVEAVSIAVPAVFHHQVAAPFLDAGIHVLVEKPIAASREEAVDLAGRAAKSGVVLQTGHVERFSPAMRAMGETIRTPRRIACVRHSPWTGRSTDVDVVLDLMIHDIDHALVLAGAPVTGVSACGRSVHSTRIDEAEAWLTFANGAAATLSACRVAERPARRVTVTEAERVLVAELSAPSFTIADRASGETHAVPLEANDNLGDQIAAFIASVAEGAPVAVDAAAAASALDVALKIQAAMAEEHTPPVPEYAVS